MSKPKLPHDFMTSGLRNQSGKGDTQRGSSKEEKKKFDEGWDRVFGKKKLKELAEEGRDLDIPRTKKRKKKPASPTTKETGDGGQIGSPPHQGRTEAE